MFRLTYWMGDPFYLIHYVGNKVHSYQSIITVLTHQVKEIEGGIDDTSVQCVFWDINASNGYGDWSGDGCQRSTTTSGERVVCHCDHLTSFAVLVVRKCFDEFLSICKHMMTILFCLFVCLFVFFHIQYIQFAFLSSNWSPVRLLVLVKDAWSHFLLNSIMSDIDLTL